MNSFECRRGYASWNLDYGKVNAFGKAEIYEMERILEMCNQNFFPDIKVLQIKSDKISPKRKRIFSAGANLKERADWTFDQTLAHLEYQRNVIHRLRTSPVFSIVYVDGIALGLGVEICLAADVVLASSRSTFALPEYSLGIIPGAGGYSWVRHLSKHPLEAIAWMEQGTAVSAEYARWLGIVDTVIDEEWGEDAILFRPDPSEIYVHEMLAWLSELSPEEQIARKESRYENVDFAGLFEEEQVEYARRLSSRNDNVFIV